MQPLVELTDISKKYQTPTDETSAIEGFSLKICKGDFIAIVGPSGCGKSTLLSVISGLTAPSSGTVDIADGVSIGYMLQHDHLFPWRSIRKNALLGLEIQHKLTEKNITYVEDLLKKYGLYDFRDYSPSQLSGGMRQRTALIRTLALQPDVLLLDEPFSALDYQTRLAVSDDISKIIAGEEKTAVLVTHDISEAISLAERIVVMSARPAVIKNIYGIKLSYNDSCFEKRKSPEFAGYYDKIWKDLDVHV